MVLGSGQVSGLQVLAAAPGGGGGGGILSSPLVPMVMVFVLIYFMVISPARKRQRKLQEMISGLKTGDKIVTTGGIHGVVVGISESFFQIRIADQVKIEVSRNAVAGLQTPEDA